MAGPRDGDLANECATKPGAVTELMFQFGETPWWKVLELNVATSSGMKVVCTFPVRVKGLQGKKRAEYMFGVGKGCNDLGRTRCTMRRMDGACGMVSGGGKALEEMRFVNPS